MEIQLWRVQVAQSYSQAAASKTKQITAVIRYDRMNDDDDYLLSVEHTTAADEIYYYYCYYSSVLFASDDKTCELVSDCVCDAGVR